MNTLITLLVGLQVADLWTTHQVIRRGGYEANGLTAKLFSRFGELPVLWAKVILAGIFGWFARDVLWLLAALDVIYALVVLWNYGELMIQKERDWWGAKLHARVKSFFKRIIGGL